MGWLHATLKGWEGEFLHRVTTSLLLDKRVYRTVYNVTLELSDGTTQIDQVIVSRYGIFVVEVKNYDGWIFGSEKNATWTQVFPNRQKFKFQNPLRQNYRHVKALSEVLELPMALFHSVVMFWGDSKFKTEMPENVIDRRPTTYFKSKQEVLMSDEEVEDVLEAIQTKRLKPGFATHRKHLRSLRERHKRTA